MTLDHIRSTYSVGPSPARHDDTGELDSVRLRHLRARRRLLPSGALPPVATSRLKRLVDVVAAAVALIVFLPLLLLIFFAIRIESGGPAIFRQRRGGFGGRPFVIYKFRTMSVAADESSVPHATRCDARVTQIGALLRRTSLDELPQLLNVLTGDMSLVGPRPHALVHDEYYGQRIPSYAERLQARPGITGLAQVTGNRGEIDRLETMARRVSQDLEYIQRWSLWLDVKVLAKTVVSAPFDGRAY